MGFTLVPFNYFDENGATDVAQLIYFPGTQAEQEAAPATVGAPAGEGPAPEGPAAEQVPGVTASADGAPADAADAFLAQPTIQPGCMATFANIPYDGSY